MSGLAVSINVCARSRDRASKNMLTASWRELVQIAIRPEGADPSSRRRWRISSSLKVWMPVRGRRSIPSRATMTRRVVRNITAPMPWRTTSNSSWSSSSAERARAASGRAETAPVGRSSSAPAERFVARGVRSDSFPLLVRWRRPVRPPLHGRRGFVGEYLTCRGYARPGGARRLRGMRRRARGPVAGRRGEPCCQARRVRASMPGMPRRSRSAARPSRSSAGT